MSDPNLNARWCRCIAEELARAGVRYAVLCPGSRNSPLLFALAAQTSITCISHIDERSAAFLALGISKASNQRVAVCVTSGSALANVIPACAEAHAAGLSFIVISADRPWEAHDCGAPQTMAQRGILAAFTTQSLELGEPTNDVQAVLSLRSRVSRLAQIDYAPTHINVPLRDPLPPLPDPTWQPSPLPDEALHGRGSTQPYTIVHRPLMTQAMPVTSWMKPGLKGLIVAGCGDRSGYARSTQASVIRLAQVTGWPVLADIASGLRQPDMPNLITTADALCTGPLAALTADKPEIIIQIGTLPLARAVYEWLGKQNCPWISVESHANSDAAHRSWLSIQGDPSAALDSIAQRCAPGDTPWRERWMKAELTARQRVTEVMAVEPWNELLAAHTSLNHNGFSFVHLASSMSIRHANVFTKPHARPTFANRGLNGIDGTLGTFLGECIAQPGLPGLLLTGDLAFLHDLPALAAALPSSSMPALRGAIVILNNQGGAIFDYLPVARVPGYERWVHTGHRLTFSGSAAQFGLTYHGVSKASELQAALDHAAVGTGLSLIECHVAGNCVERLRACLRRMAE